MTRSPFFGNLDFTSIPGNPSFKEASVRSFIIDPLLQKLGYTAEHIILEKTIQIQTGSKKQTTPYYADYALKIDSSFVCVIEAKAPEKSIADNSLIEQAFSYAVHNEIRSNYFALCNGLDFALYRTDLDRSQLLHFGISEIDQYWDDLKRFLSRDSFQSGKEPQYIAPKEEQNKKFDEQSYCSERLLDEISPRKQSARRYFGCTAYFTRQAWNVVDAYLKNYSRKGDIILDPFGGTGVTAIEALLNNRQSIHIDINPLSAFMVDALIAPISIMELRDAFETVVSEYIKNEPKTEQAIKDALKKYPQPKDLPLPKGSDVNSVHKLFTEQQRAQLSLLKFLIKKHKDINVQKSLMLAFYNTVGAVNRTQHQMPNGGPINFVMYYRYRIAPKPANLPTLETFEQKFKRLLLGKEEMAIFDYAKRISDIKIVKGSATDLSFIKTESVDYIYTDPPYGKKIQYLDLSAMWNAWLDLDVTPEDYANEAIEGGGTRQI